jgi:D-3-phosphoglycerate dehydrogenase
VDEAALIEAAKAGRLRVASDVFSDEPEGKGGPYTSALGTVPGVVGTHHIGASTEQSQDAVAAEVVRIVETYVRTGQVLNWVNRCQRSPSTWQLVVRHFDRPGVLANVLVELKRSAINAQQIRNVIFDGARAACCAIELDQRPSDETLAAIQSRDDEVIGVDLVAL